MSDSVKPVANSPLLEVSDLSVTFSTRSGTVHAVRSIGFEIYPGERVAVVGESGSGKSMTALALLGLTPTTGVVRGSVRLRGRELLGLSDKEMAEVRGTEIGLILQDATAAMDPLKTVGSHIAESLILRRKMSHTDAHRTALELVRHVRISDPELRMRQYSHELSGGMAQRALTASVIGLEPDLLVADEPTSALDATTSNGVLELLKDLGRDRGMAMLLITHDLGIVLRFAQRVIVMYGGRIVETGSVEEIFTHPRHPYTKGLLASVPGRRGRRSVEAIPSGSPIQSADKGCSFSNRCVHSAGRTICTDELPMLREIAGSAHHRSACHFAAELQAPEPTGADQQEIELIEPRMLLEIRNINKVFTVRRNAIRGVIHAVEDASLTVHEGEVLALVGESGSGKTTLGRIVLGLEKPTQGSMSFDGVDLANRVEMRGPEIRRRIQVVFQNPNSSLDPRMRVGDIIAEPLLIHKIGTRKEQVERVNELLSLVGLEEAHADRLPFEFSGGQRQRIAIARALAPRPDLLVCDEPLTALDVSVQAQILNLLQEIQHREKLSYLFIAHDLSVVRQIADRVAVMYLGRVIETGSSIEIFARPHHPYTAALLSAISYVDPTIEKSRERIILRGALPSPLNPPSGCVFHTRCWKAQEICKKVIPDTETVSGRTFACHFPENSDLL